MDTIDQVKQTAKAEMRRLEILLGVEPPNEMRSEIWERLKNTTQCCDWPLIINWLLDNRDFKTYPLISEWKNAGHIIIGNRLIKERNEKYEKIAKEARTQISDEIWAIITHTWRQNGIEIEIPKDKKNIQEKDRWEIYTPEEADIEHKRYKEEVTKGCIEYQRIKIMEKINKK